MLKGKKEIFFKYVNNLCQQITLKFGEIGKKLY